MEVAGGEVPLLRDALFLFKSHNSGFNCFNQFKFSSYLKIHCWSCPSCSKYGSDGKIANTIGSGTVGWYYRHCHIFKNVRLHFEKDAKCRLGLASICSSWGATLTKWKVCTVCLAMRPVGLVFIYFITYIRYRILLIIDYFILSVSTIFILW